jgi:hypothetical protein
MFPKNVDFHLQSRGKDAEETVTQYNHNMRNNIQGDSKLKYSA